jgi:hypothetical protein
VQNHVQQGIMNFQFSVVFDETQFAKFVHEKAYARSGRAMVAFSKRVITHSSIALVVAMRTKQFLQLRASPV